MEDKDLQFLQKLSTLSDEAQLYFNSRIIGRCFGELKEKYKLDNDQAYDLFDDVVLADFDFSLLDKGLASKEAVVDFLGKLFLPVASFIDKNVASEIESRGGKIGDYQNLVDEFDDLMEDENFAAIEELAKLQEETFDPIEEENAALNIFTDQLKGVLKENNEAILNNLNGALTYLLINKSDFSAKINKTLLNNQEVLTEKQIMLEGNLQSGTIANWLKDFITQNGSEIFNVVVLSKYLATANNVKNLSDAEKKLVRRLLKVYRNLIFYPESLSGLSPEEWEIIPLEKEFKEAPIKIASPAKAMATPTKPVVPATPSVPVATKPLSVPAPIIPKPLPVEPASAPAPAPVDDLDKMLASYPVGSLERRALEQEIKKRQAKI